MEIKNINKRMPNDCGYVCFYKGKSYGVYAESTLSARGILAHSLNIPSKKHCDISVLLAEKSDGTEYLQPTDF